MKDWLSLHELGNNLLDDRIPVEYLSLIEAGRNNFVYDICTYTNRISDEGYPVFKGSFAYYGLNNCKNLTYATLKSFRVDKIPWKDLPWRFFIDKKNCPKNGAEIICCYRMNYFNSPLLFKNRYHIGIFHKGWFSKKNLLTNLPEDAFMVKGDPDLTHIDVLKALKVMSIPFTEAFSWCYLSDLLNIIGDPKSEMLKSLKEII